MSDLKNIGTIKIIERTLNCVDPRLIDHGKRVAFLVYKMLRHSTGFNHAQIHDACIAALLHDIGAYKTENINKLLHFETENVWEHAIYGYLFTKYFSPLNGFSPFILFHHARCEDLKYIPSGFHALSQFIFAADRIAILSLSGIRDEKTIVKHLNKNRNMMFLSETVDLILENRLYLVGEEYDHNDEFNNMLYDRTGISEEDAEAYLKMIVFSIDFRSPQTVTHTIATTCISKALAEILRLPNEDRYPVAIGAWLHDLGKSGIPTGILENPSKLSAEEMDTIRNHILLTKDILDGNVDDKINRIASRHHEKLNGSGYPGKLDATKLSLPERIVAVADIFSALHGARSYKEALPKSKVASILLEMSKQGLLDSDVVDASVEHYDSIIERINRTSVKVVEIYNEMDREHRELKKTLDNIGEDCNSFLSGMPHHTCGLTQIEEW